MKKLLLLTALLSIPAISAFGYYESDFGSVSYLATLSVVITVIFGIISILAIIRFFEMSSDVKAIKQQITTPQSREKLTYLVAIGELKKADKEALKMLVDELMPIYYNENDYNKANSMNGLLVTVLPKMERLGITLPDYVKSGEKFIDYLNEKTGNDIAYADFSPEQ